jgi:outer membrane protein OmpA-like peptidoglycan-associated protein
MGSALPNSALAQQPEDTFTSHRSQWFMGGYYRYAWVPGATFAPFYERAPSITNQGFGFIASHRSGTGVTAELGLGYMPYHFSGLFTRNGALIENTEYVSSNLALLHLTGSFMWPVPLHRMLTLEIGLGVDLGAVLGQLRRSEAVPDAKGVLRPCDGPLQPSTTGPDKDNKGAAMPFCEQAYDANGKPTPTNPADVAGAHYGAIEHRVPPVMLVPMLPHLALRFAPNPRIAIKLEAAFGLAQVWVGASVQIGLGRAAHELAPSEPEPAATPLAAAATAAAPIWGRVVGKLMEQTTNLPIARASVHSKRSFSAIQTNVEGLFVFEKIEPGPIHLEIEHPDYAAGSCDTTVPAQGGDVFVHCFLAPQPVEGAISGQVKDEQAKPVTGAHVEVTGPRGAVTVTQADGSFALPDAPAGNYRVRVEAAGYLVQLVEFEVRARETSMPQIILLKKAQTSLVRRTANELALNQQVVFQADSAEIVAGSERLLREIADLLLRNRDLSLVEIQGHTDDRGEPEHNQLLSQARADAVRIWLIHAGIEPERLLARGYGHDRPLVPNDTPENRAKNRRVQFIVQNY